MNDYQPDTNTHERYLQGKLNENEETAYELWLADHSDELADLELSLLMQQGIKQQQDTEFDPHILANKTNYWLYAVPALLLVFLSTWLLTQQTPEVFNVELLKTRGAATNEVIITKPADAWIELEIYPDQANHNYQLVVTGSTSQQQLTFENLQAEAYQSIKATIDPEKINDNQWEIQLIDNTGYVEQIFVMGVESAESKQ